MKPIALMRQTQQNTSNSKEQSRKDRREREGGWGGWGGWNTGGLCKRCYNIGQVLEHHSTERETSIRKNDLISETEAKNCITQERTFTKISLTVSATQLG